MRAEELLNAIGGVDDELVERCELRPARHPAAWMRYGALAACAVLALGVGMGLAGKGPLRFPIGSVGASGGSSSAPMADGQGSGSLSGGSAPGAAAPGGASSGDAAEGFQGTGAEDPVQPLAPAATQTPARPEPAPTVGISSVGGTGDTTKEPGQNDVPTDNDTLLRDVDFAAEYIRTDGYVEGASYPKTMWITSTAELAAYCETNRETYWLGGFSHALAEYDDGFFGDRDLILVVLEEPSGSIRHRVQAVRVTPSGLDRVQYFVQPVIERLVPEIGTADMAEWHLLIAVDKEYGAGRSELLEPEFKTVR